MTAQYFLYITIKKPKNKHDLWGTGNALFTCYDLGGGAAEVIIIVICCRLWGRRHVGSGPWPGSWPGGARKRPRVVEWQWVGVQSIVRRSARRGGSSGGGGLRLALGMLGWRRLRGRVARGVDWAVFAGVASGGDGWVMRCAGCLGVTGMGGKGAGLFGWGWGLLLGAFRRKQNYYYMILTILMVLNNQNIHSLTSANHVWTRPPGSTLNVGGSCCKMEWTIPLGRGGGLTGWAVEIQGIQMLINQHVICALHLTRKCCIGARTHAHNF